ncbi:MAG: low molecular weight phosphotyrosine protein phosphatase [Clostridiaceae bacterium]|jgi:protein-tyrosine phosphatase|nr:low molecular weight phosphotyrosine protein phosphatase [Clostridiaceae bacterium]
MNKKLFDELKKKDVIRVMFVCHGNICRSPMAEFVFAHLAEERGLSERFIIQSAATSFEECGCPPHTGTLQVLSKRGVPVYEHYATRLNSADAFKYDLFLGMDGANVTNMARILGNGVTAKILRLKDAAGVGGDVADPWYTDNFDVCYADIRTSCEKIMDLLTCGGN